MTTTIHNVDGRYYAYKESKTCLTVYRSFFSCESLFIASGMDTHVHTNFADKTNFKILEVHVAWFNNTFAVVLLIRTDI